MLEARRLAHVLDAEIALVAQPDLVHGLVLPRLHAHDLAAPRLVADRAADGAVPADRVAEREVLRARAEAIRLARERSAGAELDDVALEPGRERSAVEGPQHARRAPVVERQLGVAGDLVHEARAPVAEDAALHVEDHERREPLGLRRAPLRDLGARGVGPVQMRVVLERALPRRIAHGT